MGAAIELRGLSKHFGAKKAVNEVTLDIQEGHCYGLIGPNGAGKTTTFSMMCGYLFPTSGTVRILGHDPTEPGILKGKLGVLPQDAILPPTWPVGALLTYYGRLSNLGEPEKEARAALDRVALPETWAVPAAALSHGMAKRVSMAQALMGAPPVVFLDEPTAGLDPKIAAAVRQIIRELKGKATVVVSSHNLQELEELCDATAILDKGLLVTAGTMTDITGQSAEFRVQIAKGSPPLEEIRMIAGVKTATMEANGQVLAVNFDSSKTSPEEAITATVGLLVQKGVLILAVSRGKRLEERVLQLT